MANRDNWSWEWPWRQTQVILFDEPLAGFPPRRKLWVIVKRLAQEKIALKIEHDMDFALSITENVTF
jgi:branched-chain amino acid transport system ATP-binding protein